MNTEKSMKNSETLSRISHSTIRFGCLWKGRRTRDQRALRFSLHHQLYAQRPSAVRNLAFFLKIFTDF